MKIKSQKWNFIMNKQKYIKVDGMLINIYHIVLVNETKRNFDGNNIHLHLNNSYKINILNTDSELYRKIINFMINDTTGENVLYIYKETKREKV